LFYNKLKNVAASRLYDEAVSLWLSKWGNADNKPDRDYSPALATQVQVSLPSQSLWRLAVTVLKVKGKINVD
jgi:hypothetical protein